MLQKIIWPLFFLISGLLFIFFFFAPSSNNGGDMVEYFGMTESLINHKSINLTSQDYENLKKYLAPGYFKIEKEFVDTKGGFFAYVDGRDGNKYSLHFWAYSILATPIRLFLRIIGGNELNALRLTNLLTLTLSLGYILKKFCTKPFQQLLLIVSIYLSPLVFFISYPGVDIFYPALLLIAIFAFFNGKYIQAAILTAIASWHSQPLIITAAIATVYYLYKQNFIQKKFHINLQSIFTAVMIGLIALIPYAANFYMFGVWSPWATINDGWTTLYGFGLHNLSVQRLVEQFFDLDMGLFWYAPLLVIFGFYYLIKKSLQNRLYWILFGTIILTALAYQTNPAWHYGTAGFAPTRHILFVIPFLIYFFVTNFHIKRKTIIIIALPFLLQIYSLAMNNYLLPDFYNSLFHSSYSKLVLNHYPSLYNPTPKIFIDTTTHTDKKFIISAIYKHNNDCKKAYVTKTDQKLLVDECKYIPDKYLSQFEDEFRRKTNYTRKVFTIEATFWADPDSCGINYRPLPEQKYVCMHTVEDFINYTGFNDISRIEKLPYEGAWKIKRGDVIALEIPPGYYIDHYSLEGLYINY